MLSLKAFLKRVVTEANFDPDALAEEYTNELERVALSKGVTGKTLTRNRYGAGVYHGYYLAVRVILKEMRGET